MDQSYTTWEEDLLNADLSELFDAGGKKLGEVRRIGGSWECQYGTTSIAVRPDKHSAQTCVSRYHDAAQKDKGAAPVRP